eukprot:449412-Amphidinium_carterae.1
MLDEADLIACGDRPRQLHECWPPRGMQTQCPCGSSSKVLYSDSLCSPQLVTCKHSRTPAHPNIDETSLFPEQRYLISSPKVLRIVALLLPARIRISCKLLSVVFLLLDLKGRLEDM